LEEIEVIGSEEFKRYIDRQILKNIG